MSTIYDLYSTPSANIHWKLNVRLFFLTMHQSLCTVRYIIYAICVLPLKGQSNEIFDLQFFSSFEPTWATDKCYKWFSVLIKFLLSYSNFFESPRSIIFLRVILPGEIILRRVNFPGVSYSSKSFVKICVEISLGYHTE